MRATSSRAQKKMSATSSRSQKKMSATSTCEVVKNRFS
jgi:hypothetical protein